MRRDKKVALIMTALAGMVVIGIMMAGCTQTAEQPEPEASVPAIEPDEPDAVTPAPPQMDGRGMPAEMMNEVAEILGIAPEQVEAAFTQAQDEMAETAVDGPGPDSLMSRVAEILGIEPQELESAMAQVIGEMSADGSPPGPPDGGPGPWDPENGSTP
mgnify:CR=1 FL=1